MKQKGRLLLKRYKFFLALIAVNIAVVIAIPPVGAKALNATWENTLEMLAVIPPIFILLGLLDVWVPRETMIRFMGRDSGMKGALIAFLLGSAAAGPLYVAFPVAGMLLKKGAGLFNVLLFIGAWSTTKLPMLLFEASAMGWRFMLTRLVIDIAGIAFIAFVTGKLLKKEDVAQIYDRAETMDT